MANVATQQPNGILFSEPTMFRNRIINGDMRIDQRLAGTQPNTVATQYHVDRWNYLGTIATKFTIQKSSTAPAGFTSSLLLTSSATTVPGLTDWWALRYFIEGLNVADLAWGSSSAKTITVSFWARSSLTGTFSGTIMNDAANRSYPFSYTINAANTFEYKTVTIPGDTTGTWTTDNTAGIRLIFSLGGGTSVQGVAGAWSAGALWGGATGSTNLVGTNTATLYITGVQLEQGIAATPFEFRSYGTELALCQRYCYRMIPSVSNQQIAVSHHRSATLSIAAVRHPVLMRGTPNFEVNSGTSYFGLAVGAGDQFTTTLSANVITSETALIQVAATGLSPGSAGVIQFGSTSAYWGFSAEL